MSRRRKVRPLRLALLILLTISLCFIVFFASKAIINKISEPTTEKVQETATEEKTSNEDTTISIEDYIVYIDEDNEVGFNFVIANLKFVSSKETINYDLNNLSTSERVYLGSVRSFEEILTSKGYDISKLGYAKEIRNDQGKEVTAKVFIPYTNVKGELCVYNGEVLKFNLYNNNEKMSNLKLSSDINETVVGSDDYNLTVHDSYVENRMLCNGETATYPSTIEIYSFILHVNSINKNLVVEEAKFMPANSSEEIKALDKEYSSAICENMIGKQLNTNDEYALFFAVQNPQMTTTTSFNGKLLIKFENDSTWLEISTVHD